MYLDVQNVCFGLKSKISKIWWLQKCQPKGFLAEKMATEANLHLKAAQIFVKSSTYKQCEIFCSNASLSLHSFWKACFAATGASG